MKELNNDEKRDINKILEKRKRRKEKILSSPDKQLHQISRRETMN